MTEKNEYSVAGIMQFLYNESMKNEILRAQWNVEKAELQARIAFLQGERRGQENLKIDLIRRIKMLEYSLTMENDRIKQLRRLKSNDASVINEQCDEDFSNIVEIKPTKYKLNEIRSMLIDGGYKDMMSEIRETRVKHLLGSVGGGRNVKDVLSNISADNRGGNDINDNDNNNNGRNFTLSNAELQANMDANKLQYDDSPIYDTVDDSSSSSGIVISVPSLYEDNKICTVVAGSPLPAAVATAANTDGGVVVGGGGTGSNIDVLVSHDETVCASLGELASLTIANESSDGVSSSGGLLDDNKSGSSSGGGLCRTLPPWAPKYTLRNHYDAVRCLAFHPSQALLITGSEDCTVKLWNLVSNNPASTNSSGSSSASRKSSSSSSGMQSELEPVYTYRNHTSPVLSLLVSDEVIYSSDLHGDVKCWIIKVNSELYDEYDHSSMNPVTFPHSSAVWSMTLQEQSGNLITGSTDGKLSLWSGFNGAASNQFIGEIELPNSAISSMQLNSRNDEEVVVGNRAGDIMLVNLVTGRVVRYFSRYSDANKVLDSNIHAADKSPVYQLIEHQSRSLIISGHEDRYIRMFDITSGQMVSSLIAHLDAVTCLGLEKRVDPDAGGCSSSNSNLISGSHDCSVRIWDLTSQSCIQETTTHRKKFDESINALAVHPTMNYFATGGADAIVKVFV